jgi:hypothetical protein
MKLVTGLQQARKTDSSKVRVVMGTELLAITAAANINADHNIVTSFLGGREQPMSVLLLPPFLVTIDIVSLLSFLQMSAVGNCQHDVFKLTG